MISSDRYKYLGAIKYKNLKAVAHAARSP